MKKRLLLASVILNAVLIIALILLLNIYRGLTFKIMSDWTSSNVRFSEHILEVLNSGDQNKINGIKKTLQFGIENGEKTAAVWQRAADRTLLHSLFPQTR